MIIILHLKIPAMHQKIYFKKFRIFSRHFANNNFEKKIPLKPWLQQLNAPKNLWNLLLWELSIRSFYCVIINNYSSIFLPAKFSHFSPKKLSHFFFAKFSRFLAKFSHLFFGEIFAFLAKQIKAKFCEKKANTIPFLASERNAKKCKTINLFRWKP